MIGSPKARRNRLDATSGLICWLPQDELCRPFLLVSIGYILYLSLSLSLSLSLYVYLFYVIKFTRVVSLFSINPFFVRELRMEIQVPLSRVIQLLNLIPLDGLRKTAEALAIDTPDRSLSTAAQATELIKTLGDLVATNNLVYLKKRIESEPMWKECHANSPVPVIVEGDAIPELTAELKISIHNNIKTIIDSLGGKDAIQNICPGKVSSATKVAEESGICKRWRDRYGKPEYDYTLMRRLYVDKSGSSEYKKREALALAVEKHAFEILRNLLGHSNDAISFSDEPGRQSTGKTTGPQWRVMVYLAIKLKNEKKKKK